MFHWHERGNTGLSIMLPASYKGQGTFWITGEHLELKFTQFCCILQFVAIHETLSGHNGETNRYNNFLSGSSSEEHDLLSSNNNYINYMALVPNDKRFFFNLLQTLF